MKYRHYAGLAIVLALGTAIRFWNLDLKPLWLDEVLTALFSLGRSYKDVPLEELLSLDRIEQIFTLNRSVSCPEIARNIATDSTHPPLFFCLMNAWLKASLIPSVKQGWVFVLRSLPALFGVGAIASVYFLNRIAFSKTSGLAAAALMAVSPFAVYLSQEARHYTLPLFLITLSLVGLIQIQQDLERQKRRSIVWLGWVIINSIGLYVHYFFILVLIAQLATLLVLFSKAKLKNFLLPFAFCLLPFAFFIPWLPVLQGHFARPETGWLPQPQHIVPLCQTLLGWLLMAIILPVENQPLWVAIPLGLLMLFFGFWLGWQFFQGMRLWKDPATHLSTLTLGSFTLFVLLEFLAIIYLMGKDITVAPRYNFVYYPAVCALLGASLVVKGAEEQPHPRPLWVQRRGEESRVAGKQGGKKNHPLPITNYQLPIATVLLVGFVSCIFVVNSLAFEKPYNPQRVAQNMLIEPSVPLMVVVGYEDFQDVALGLSFALAVNKLNPNLCKQSPNVCPKIAFLKRSPGYESVWQNLSQIPNSLTFTLNLWVVGPGLKRDSYPQQLTLSGQNICIRDRDRYHRIGIPYQLYRCAGNRY